MRLSIFITAVLTTVVAAMPDPLPQGYTGPCTTAACGASGKACPRGYLCVGWPVLDPALRKGCACSYG
ncbi:hypothetical protein M011DRAFT_399611 [Sporormia fimetaria CBS 119925]|uniref:Uncharacterized protein n=1 Tax=Sporormia fimetaria CBS 119925 TaxID=1340428 RepID=A0A6A6VEL5_9PLEO|nr:hypothetical protein M011DRAFT_399611 [Sporormia fimetaria CBS 119925]